FAAATAERRFSVAIAHGELVSRVPEYGNLGTPRAVFRGLDWLTLPPPFAHKRAGPGARHRLTVLTSSMAGSAASKRLGLRCCWTGECPEWQRELTVNQPSYDFEGSSPSSPTSLRSRSERRLPRRSPTGAGGLRPASYGSASHPR